jgi:hypothetical protein
VGKRKRKSRTWLKEEMPDLRKGIIMITSEVG